jgi:hypothetical protein
MEAVLKGELQLKRFVFCSRGASDLSRRVGAPRFSFRVKASHSAVFRSVNRHGKLQPGRVTCQTVACLIMRLSNCTSQGVVSARVPGPPGGPEGLQPTES